MSNSKRCVLSHRRIDSRIPVYSSLWQLQEAKKEEKKKGAKKKSKASGEEKENNQPAENEAEVHPMADVSPV